MAKYTPSGCCSGNEKGAIRDYGKSLIWVDLSLRNGDYFGVFKWGVYVTARDRKQQVSPDGMSDAPRASQTMLGADAETPRVRRNVAARTTPD
jgi:hypothetical protein